MKSTRTFAASLQIQLSACALVSVAFECHRELEGKVADLEKRYSRAGVAAERREMRAEVAEAQRLRQNFEKQAAADRRRLLVCQIFESSNRIMTAVISLGLLCEELLGLMGKAPFRRFRIVIRLFEYDEPVQVV